jgi:putative colanic acid biosynthesis acetyltransferase WcaF
MTEQAKTDLGRFDNSWYDPGRSLGVRMAWLLVSRVCFQTSVPWPSTMKAALLRLFGASVGQGVIIKPCVTVKYPWNVTIGDHAWIGERVWIDSLAKVRIGSHACLSQGCMIETGNHDWSRPGFDLLVRDVNLDEGSWAAVKSLLLPGSRLASHAVLGAASVLAGDTDAYGIYVGNPARRVNQRKIRVGP